MSMGKVRVYEISKEVGIDSKTLVSKLQTLGYDVRSHASALDESEAHEAIQKLISEQKANIVQQRISGRVIRRRAKDAPPEETAEAQEHLEQQEPEPGSPSAEATAHLAASEPPEQAASSESSASAAPVGEIDAEPATLKTESASSAVTHDALEPEESKTQEEPAEKPPARRVAPADSSTRYRAQVIRRPTPAPAAPTSDFQARVISRPPVDDRPTGIRVLKVIPGKEGRGREFIDLSQPEKGKKKPASERTSRAHLREQLFDAFSQDFVPGISRRKRMARRAGHKTNITTPRAQKRVIRMESCEIMTAELAKRMGVKLADINRKLKDMGEDITDIQDSRTLTMETAVLLAQEFEHDIQDATFKEESILKACNPPESPEERIPRPPVVTVMGHVDHGKTSILDAIRKTKVAEGEEGGITQHIGAYEVFLPKGSITFIDTPGHEAFSAMRARGAGVTDIVVLVVAADDGIMPQTIEAIHHAQEAKVPILVAINKMDLPNGQPDRIRQAVTEYGLVAEEWGGDTIFIEVSAKTKSNLDKLLDNILVQAEMMELTGNPKQNAEGAIIEARLDRGRGPISTLLVKNGTLRKGDIVVVGLTSGRVRMMFDAAGKTVDEVGPGRPIQVQGIENIPMAGDRFHVVNNEREAKKILDHRHEEKIASHANQTSRLSIEDFYERLQGNEKPELKVLLKADVQGSAEAVRDALLKLSTPKVGVNVIHHGVGAVTETDVNLASASKAILVGFNVRPDPNAKKLAQTLNVEIRLYKIIYDLTEDVRKAQQGLLPSLMKENVIGRAEVRDLFNVPKVGTVAGVSVTDGKMMRGALIRLLRDNVEVHQGKMSSLKRFKEDVREVASGFECGIGIENFNDIKRGDIIEAYLVEAHQANL
jgi:translation initiation factor IF-2